TLEREALLAQNARSVRQADIEPVRHVQFEYAGSSVEAGDDRCVAPARRRHVDNARGEDAWLLIVVLRHLAPVGAVKRQHGVEILGRGGGQRDDLSGLELEFKGSARRSRLDRSREMPVGGRLAQSARRREHKSDEREKRAHERSPSPPRRGTQISRYRYSDA